MPQTAAKPARTLPWMVLLLCAAATVWAWQAARADARGDLQAVFRHEADAVVDAVWSRVGIYSDMMHGARGLFAASKSVERLEWHAYIRSLRIIDRFPGIRAMSFVAAVPSKDLDAFLEQTRADGAPDFAVRSPSAGELLYIIKYEEMFGPYPSPFGYDMAYESHRKAIADQARDTGELAATGFINLITDQTPGFLLFLSIYREGMLTSTVDQRREAIQGWVLSVFRGSDFAKEVAATLSAPVAFELFDGPSADCARALYTQWSCGDPAAGRAAPPAGLEESRSLPVGGRLWTILVRPKPEFIQRRQDSQSFWVLLIGAIVSLLLVAVVWSLVNTQTRAAVMAENMTKELREAQMQLTRAAKLESTGRLAAGVAHEVKNPLAIVVMGLDYLETHLENHSNPQIIQVLRDMRAAIHRADFIVKGLLNFSSQRELILRPHNLNEIVEQSLALVKHELNRAHIQVEVRLDPRMPQLSLDKSRLEQVFINLFINAVQAMNREGELIVTTSFRDEPRQESCAIVTVEDTGPGIPEKLLGKVFDPFFTTKPTGQGTGLGLTVTQKIIELHGGTIVIANRQEGGAIITLQFGAHSAH